MHRPSLRLTLIHDGGEEEIERWADPAGSGRERSVAARYFRIRCENLTRTGPAHEVQIVIEKLELPGPNGAPRLEYRGPLPLVWQHAEAFPTQRTVGGSVVADLLSVTEDRTLRLLTVVTPNKYASAYAGHTTLWITVAARSVERDSAPIRFKISWDGRWHPGEVEMKAHLTVERD